MTSHEFLKNIFTPIHLRVDVGEILRPEPSVVVVAFLLFVRRGDASAASAATVAPWRCAGVQHGLKDAPSGVNEPVVYLQHRSRLIIRSNMYSSLWQLNVILTTEYHREARLVQRIYLNLIRPLQYPIFK